ncbi:NADH-FMN oxidoreductase RutF, flavin reductase (DIM6/NTAB) family [Kytococcus aerolatus]|uniref:NADH-FMN oxidoreductase RutF, flavin reductase (DIM6/NTAB) family n=1 Tax=Kytococcus aerolatus TaxID=592308 RepID=A0A212T8C1_9MICO|nr:flavin reductase [Kytococcus aerolatus]SNC62091.1 NADH-FMN oxidoreductase RutF, flavin reductase (DIM6/NTAB) family [Kytococcus aerolatus]
MSSPDPRDLPVLALHAHPDDESLWTGVALATLAERGHPVHVLTFTLGDHGEVIPAGLQHLEGAEGGAALAAHRRHELAAACAALGVQHRVVGEAPGVPDPGAVRWLDSGMVGSPQAEHPRALAGAPVDELAAEVAAEIERVGAGIVLTYDEHGGYGHPDHVAVHRAATTAVRRLPQDRRPELYAAVTPRSWAVADRRWVQEHVEPVAPSGEFHGRPTAGVLVPDVEGAGEPYPPSVRDDEVVTHEIHATAGSAAAVDAARSAHATQVLVHDGWWQLSNLVAQRTSGREGYSRIDPVSGRVIAGDSDLRAPLAGPMAPVDDMRAAMGELAAGVCVLSTRAGGQVQAMTASAVVSLSLYPVLLGVVVGTMSRWAEAVEESGVFAVSVLADSARGAGEWLATPGRPLVGQLTQVPTYSGSVTGLPLLQESLATLECRLVRSVPVGDHTLFVGLVEEAATAGAAGGPLLTHRGRMRGIA